MSAPRPYVPRRAGDPIVASDWNEVVRQHQAAVDAHDHVDGRGALLTGDSFDSKTDIAVAAVTTASLQLGGADLGERLDGTLQKSGGTVTGGLEIAGTLRVAGDCIVSSAQPITVLGAQTEQWTNHSHETRDIVSLRDANGNHGVRTVGRLHDLSEADVSLDLPDDSLLIVQLLAAFRGTTGGYSGSNTGAIDPAGDGRLALWAERGGRRGFVGGLGAAGGAVDLETLLDRPDAGADVVILGPGSIHLLGPFSTYELPIAQTWLLRVPRGELRLGVAASGLGTFFGACLHVTTLPELNHV